MYLNTTPFFQGFWQHLDGSVYLNTMQFFHDFWQHIDDFKIQHSFSLEAADTTDHSSHVTMAWGTVASCASGHNHRSRATVLDYRPAAEHQGQTWLFCDCHHIVCHCHITRLPSSAWSVDAWILCGAEIVRSRHGPASWVRQCQSWTGFQAWLRLPAPFCPLSL